MNAYGWGSKQICMRRKGKPLTFPDKWVQNVHTKMHDMHQYVQTHTGCVHATMPHTCAYINAGCLPKTRFSERGRRTWAHRLHLQVGPISTAYSPGGRFPAQSQPPICTRTPTSTIHIYIWLKSSINANLPSTHTHELTRLSPRPSPHALLQTLLYSLSFPNNLVSKSGCTPLNSKHGHPIHNQLNPL